MFKIIKTELFDEFKCLMGACKDNCCDENWLIIIDDATYELYQSMGIENLDEKVTAQAPHSLIKKNGKCPFITLEGLCILHRDMGEKYISNTCRSYPRFVSTYGDLYVENIGLSCPASASWIVSLSRKIKLLEKVYYEDQSEVGKTLPASEDELRMKSIVDTFYRNDTLLESVKDIEHIMDKKILDEQLTEICSGDFVRNNELLAQNIGISFLFENLMLESLKTESDYAAVVGKSIRIIGAISEKYSELASSGRSVEENLSDAIYKTMRIEDHGI